MKMSLKRFMGHRKMEVIDCVNFKNLWKDLFGREVLKYKKDGYRQQNVRQRQKLISIIDYDVCYEFLLVRHCNYSSILYYLGVI